MYHRFESASARVMMLALFGLLLPACNSARAVDELDRLQGYWRVDNATGDIDSRTLPKELFQFCWFRVEGDELTLMVKEFHDPAFPQWRIRLLSDKKPKQFEMIDEADDVVGRGNYQLRDDAFLVFDADVKTPPKEFSGDIHSSQIRLARVPPAYAKRVLHWQGVWKASGEGHHNGLTGGPVLIMGELAVWHTSSVHQKVFGGFRWDTKAESPAVDFSWFFSRRLSSGKWWMYRWPGGTWSLEGDNEFCHTLAGKRTTYERMTEEEQVNHTLALVIPKHPLSSKKRALQQLVNDYPGTKVVEAAKKELSRMPSDEEIAELDADEMLQKALKLNSPSEAKKVLRDIIEAYPATKAAVKAKLQLETMIEKEAADKLKIALMLRDGDKPEAARKWLQRVVKHYEGTEAAEEAKRLLKRTSG